MDCVFIIYAYNNSACWSFVHKSSIKDIYPNIIIESRNAIFFKMSFHLKIMIEANSSNHYQSKYDEVAARRSKKNDQNI